MEKGQKINKLIRVKSQIIGKGKYAVKSQERRRVTIKNNKLAAQVRAK